MKRTYERENKMLKHKCSKRKKKKKNTQGNEWINVEENSSEDKAINTWLILKVLCSFLLLEYHSEISAVQSKFCFLLLLN